MESIPKSLTARMSIAIAMVAALLLAQETFAYISKPGPVCQNIGKPVHFVLPSGSSSCCRAVSRLEFGFRRMPTALKQVVSKESDLPAAKVACRRADGSAGPRKVVENVHLDECRRLAEEDSFAGFEHACRSGRCENGDCELDCACELMRTRPSHAMTEKVGDDYESSACWVKEFERFALVVTKVPSGVSGKCAAPKGAGGPMQEIRDVSIIECGKYALRHDDTVLAFEYNDKDRTCALMDYVPEGAEMESGVWCFAKNQVDREEFKAPGIEIPLPGVSEDHQKFCRDKFASRYLESFKPSNKLQYMSHEIDRRELLEYFRAPSDRNFDPSHGTALDTTPYETCYYKDEYDQSICFHVDADLLRTDCLCRDLLVDRSALSSLPTADKLRASFNAANLEQCYMRLLDTAQELLGVDAERHRQKTEDALSRFEPYLLTACEELHDNLFTGKSRQFDMDMCAQSATYRIMAREVESALACYTAAAVCDDGGELKGDNSTCNGWRGSRNRWF